MLYKGTKQTIGGLRGHDSGSLAFLSNVLSVNHVRPIWLNPKEKFKERH